MTKPLAFGIASLLAISSHLRGAAFTPGNLVIERVGDGAAALGGSATALFLDEFSFTGSLFQSIALPTIGDGSITDSGSTTSLGQLNLSTDGRFLTPSGIDADLGTTAVQGTASATNPRSTAVFDVSGSITGTIDITGTGNPYSGETLRSVVSTNGSNFWSSGSGTATTGGIWYFGTSGVATQLSTALTNGRNIDIFGGQLYATTGAGTRGLYAIGSGLPTTGGQAVTNIIATGATSSPYGFSLADLNPLVAGLDTAWISDDRTAANGGGIQRYNFDGSVWTLAYTLNTGGTTGARGLTVDLSGAAPRLFATTTEASANRLVSIFDTGNEATAEATLLTLATAGTNTAFRGVDFTPVPEPSTFGAAALGVALLSLTQRTRRRLRA